jgi:pimeloyl-ACP methyl ester carboxylesterase
MVGIELAARYPTLPQALVLVDPGPIDPLPTTIRTFEALAEQLAGPEGEAVRRAYVEDMGSLDDELGRRIADSMCSVPLRVAAAVIRTVMDWNGVGALTLCAVPTLLLRSSVSGTNEIGRLRELKPDLEFAVTVGAGHFHQIEVPDQVNAIIERFLAVAL